jgi:hypothetical protein
VEKSTQLLAIAAVLQVIVTSLQLAILVISYKNNKETSTRLARGVENLPNKMTGIM